jgi:predicted Zn-dependent protease
MKYLFGVLVLGVALESGFGQVNGGTAPTKAAHAGKPIEVAQEVTPTPSTPLAEATELAAKGHLTQALARLEPLTKAEPEQAGVERLKGMILYQKDQLPEAAKALARAVSQDATDRESVEMLGITLYRLARPEEAIPLLEAADFVPVKGTNIEPHYVLGLCYTDVKRYDDARHAFATQYGFAPDSAEAYLLAARLFLRREFAAEAAVQAQKALEINPALPLAHQLLGEIALSKQDIPEAIRELEAERKINPLDGLLYERLGDAYLRHGQYDEAQQALNRGVVLEPNATAPYILLGEVFLKLQQPIQALHYLDHAVKMDPTNYLTHNLLGQAYKATGQVDEANREFQMVYDLQHNNKSQPAEK